MRLQIISLALARCFRLLQFSERVSRLLVPDCEGIDIHARALVAVEWRLHVWIAERHADNEPFR